MKISFQNQDPAAMGIQTTLNSKYNSYETSKGNSAYSQNGIHLELGRQTKKTGDTTMNGYGMTGNGIFGQDSFLQRNSEGKQRKTMAEIQQEAGNMDVGVSQDYQTVLANTLSQEDYAKAQEEGFSYESMSQADVVTIQDKVKAEVAKSGTVVAGYNDDLDRAVLENALGDAALAQVVEKAMTEANLPLSEENAEDISKAWQVASSLVQPSEEQVAYLVEQEMDPTIWNLYQVENTVNAPDRGSMANLYQKKDSTEEASASTNIVSSQNVSLQVLDKPENEKLRLQVENIVKEAGFLPEEGTTFEKAMQVADWLLQKELPVSKESLEMVEAMERISFPISKEEFAQVSVAAISRGEEPLYADLTEKEDIYHLAAQLEKEWFAPEKWEETTGNLVARRQLEEVRLSMTAEVNVKLLSSDFSIDTAPMEELIDALKEAEKQVAARYFPAKYEESPEQAVADYRLMKETNQVASDLSQSPAAALGMFKGRDIVSINVEQYHEEALLLEEDYRKADSSYEALMTAPRADLGDSLRKAFSNVQELVENLGMETSEENLRAARILGYNQMSISKENMEKIVAADRQVQSVVSKMTPANVLQMIRQGINPLKENFQSLENYFNTQEMDSMEAKSAEEKDYAAFLYGLERRDDITQTERDAYIGIYRMIHQIEKNEGAAIGSVVNAQVELQFRNLLSAVRSTKARGIDVKVEDSFGSIESMVRQGKTITEQISAGFSGQQNSEQYHSFRQAADISKEAAELVSKSQVVDSAENLIAAQTLLSCEENLYGELLKQAGARNRRDTSGESKNEELLQLLKRGENLLEDADSFEEEYAEYTESLKKVAEEMIYSGDYYLDVKAMQLVGRQLSLAKALATPAEETAKTGDREYIVPMTIGEETAKVRLTLRSDETQGSSLFVRAYLPNGETGEAQFYMEKNQLQGFLVGNNGEELQNLETVADILFESLKKELGEGMEVTTFSVLLRGEGTTNRFVNTDQDRSKDASKNTSDGADTRKLLQVAKVYLRAVKEAL